MGSTVKLTTLILFFLILGALGGFYYGKSSQPPKIIEIKNEIPVVQNKEMPVVVDEETKNLTLEKLSLLKRYTNFVILPSEKIPDSAQYAAEMEEKVKAINDEEITARFYATGENENKEQKIADFLDFLNESIRSDVQK